MKADKKKNGRKVAKSRGVKGERAKGGKTAFRATFMESILLKKGELEKALEHLKDLQREYDGQLSGGDLIDDLDRAQREISASSYYPLIERKTKELQNIELLIARMSRKKKFGLCEECGKPIPRERLLVIPEATLCVTCQRELEKMDSQRSVETGASTDFGRERNINWVKPTDFDDKGYLAMKTQNQRFSVTDVTVKGFPPSQPPLVHKPPLMGLL